MFGNEDLSALVECAERALKAEDRYLAGCANKHGWRPPVGIDEVTNERFLQYVIWRALILLGDRGRNAGDRKTIVMILSYTNQQANCSRRDQNILCAVGRG